MTEPQVQELAPEQAEAQQQLEELMRQRQAINEQIRAAQAIINPNSTVDLDTLTDAEIGNLAASIIGTSIQALHSLDRTITLLRYAATRLQPELLGDDDDAS